MRIRVATSRDRDDIRDIHLQVFPEEEGRLIAELAGSLLREESEPATINLVAETGGEVVGHIALSPVYALPNKKWLGYILAPLAVKLKHHKKGIGSKLVKNGIERVSEIGTNFLLVYGDPQYYGRFGFEAKHAVNLLPPYELRYSFGWQVIVLNGSGANEQVVHLSCVAPLENPALW